MDACVRQAIQGETTSRAQIIGPGLSALMGAWTEIQKAKDRIHSRIRKDCGMV